MSSVRANQADLYTPIYDEFMLQTFAEPTQVGPKVFQSIDDSTKEYKTNGISGLGKWVAANEGSGGGYEDPVIGYEKTFTQGKFWKKLQVSFESVDQDEYALLKEEGNAKAIGRGARAKTEYDQAQVLINGFSTACPDGQYLFSDSHPKNPKETGTTYDNLLSGAFSHDALEDAEQQMAANFMDPTGLPIEFAEDPIILYPPALRGAVKRVLSDRALEQPDTAVRNINQFAGRYKPIEWRWLSAALGGSDTAWFIIFNELEFLKMIWSCRPHFTSWIDEDLEFYNFKGRMLYDCGASDWRCGFASTGS